MLKKLFGKRSQESVSPQILELFTRAVERNEPLDVFLGDTDAYDGYRKLGKEAPFRSSAMAELDSAEHILKIEYVFPRTPVFRSNPIMLFFSVDGVMFYCSTTIAAVDRENDIISVHLPTKVHRNERRKVFRVRISQYNIRCSLKNISKTELAHSQGQVKAFDYDGKAYDISEGGLFFMSFATMTLDINDVVYLEFTLPGIDLLPRTSVKVLARVAHIKSFNRFCGLEFFTEKSKNVPYVSQYPYLVDSSLMQHFARFCRAANISNLESENLMERSQQPSVEATLQAAAQERRDVVIIGDRSSTYYNNEEFEQRYRKHYLSDEREILDFLEENEDCFVIFDNLVTAKERRCDFTWSAFIKTLRSKNLFHPVFVIDSDPMEKLKKQKLQEYKIFHCCRFDITNPADLLKQIRTLLPAVQKS